MDSRLRSTARLATVLGLMVFVGLNLHGASASITVESLANQIIARTNIERGRHGLPLLKPDRLLATAAHGHSEEMVHLDYFSHESPTPGHHTVSDRVFATGSTEVEVGENIAFYEGYSLDQIAERVVTDWMNSPGHRANLLRPGYNLIGVGVYTNGKKTMATQVFGARHLSLELLRIATQGSRTRVHLRGVLLDRSREVGIFDQGVPLRRVRVAEGGAFETTVSLPASSGLHRLNVGPLSHVDALNACFSITNVIRVDTSAVANR